MDRDTTLQGIYCNSLFNYSRFKTREVTIGDIPLGGNNPIRIQSMTTTNTMDTLGTVEQSIRMIESGCDYIRITAPSLKEAQNLDNIKKELKKRGYSTPLIADIHFTPNAAELSARLVEKVRVNPGNYVDKKKFETIEYTDLKYQAELERIYKRFSPLVKICKEYGTAMRIGTNHGSLSDRILSRYGDTPLGMVESAMEFIRICEDLNYHNLVISMKASNTLVMVEGYRMLVQQMVKENMNYPLHLGVTEAGDGEDGRIKSALGIGALLEDGLGDTIRVSLTEEPEFEAPVAISLANRYSKRNSLEKQIEKNIPSAHKPFEYSRRKTKEIHSFGKHQVPRIIIDIKNENLKDSSVLSEIGYQYSPLLDKYNIGDMSADYVYLGDQLPSFNFPGSLGQIYNYSTWRKLKNQENAFPLLNWEEFNNGLINKNQFSFLKIHLEKDEYKIENLKGLENSIFIIESDLEEAMMAQRSFFFELLEKEIQNPVIIKRNYSADIKVEDFQIHSSTDIGALLVDGYGDGAWISAEIDIKIINSTLFGILQASRTRISKTEYISCPSCGRTLFNLQETTQKIRNRTDHLKGIKIGIMGCIVNGPGEMADADYGYVGTGPGKITLYRGKEVVRKNVDSDHAVDELIEIIKEDDNWIEKK